MITIRDTAGEADFVSNSQIIFFRQRYVLTAIPLKFEVTGTITGDDTEKVRL